MIKLKRKIIVQNADFAASVGKNEVLASKIKNSVVTVAYRAATTVFAGLSMRLVFPNRLDIPRISQFSLFCVWLQINS